MTAVLDTSTTLKLAEEDKNTGELRFKQGVLDCISNKSIGHVDDNDNDPYFIVEKQQIKYFFDIDEKNLNISGEPELVEKLKNSLLECLSSKLPTPPALRPTVLSDSFKKSQTAFLESLTPDEKAILNSYTHHGDRITNAVLRGTPLEGMRHHIESLPMTEPKGTTLGLIPSYVAKFMNVIKKAPIVTEEMTLYRGINAGSSPYQESNGNEVLSTTYDPKIAKTFAGSSSVDHCCFITIRVIPGVRVLWIEPISRFPDEREVILIPPFMEVIESRKTLRDLVVAVSPSKRSGGTRKTRRWKMPRKMTRRYCRKTSCRKMGFTQKASCRPWKNCY